MYDGFNSYCKNCIKKVTADYMKKYSKTDKGKAALKKGREKLIEAGYFRYGYGAISHIRQAALRRGSSFNLTSWPVPQISYTNLV
ncbi:MAG: hypothetical protein UX81_C0022G0009 [Parcubacteria group bacterium GW2011_GWA2_47_12]|nr:MAG: hypothetical protein UX81_C0022G0009 [Parcubacteria group bacterium GW2011_GWA2_47_12]